MKRRPLFTLAIFLTGALLLNACGTEPTPAPAITTVAVTTPTASTPSVAASTSAATTGAAITSSPAVTTATSTPVTTTGQTSGFLAAKYSTPVLESGHSSFVYAVALSPDGKTVATGSDDTSVKLWDVATNKLLYTFKDYGHGVLALAFSPDGKRLAAAGYNPTVNVWDIASGKTIQVLEIKNAYSFAALAYSADGKFLAGTNDDKNVYVWDTASGSLKNTLKGQTNQLGVAFSPDAKLLAAGEKSSQINVWDLSQPDKPLATFKSKFYAYALKFSSDSKAVFGGDSLWEISSGKALSTFPNPVLGVSADGQQAGFYDSSKKRFEIINLQTSQQTATLGVTSDPSPGTLYFSPDFKTLVTTTYSSAATLYDLSQNRVQATIGDNNASDTIVAISPDSTLIAHTTVKDYEQTFEILNAADGKVLSSFKIGVSGIKQMAFSADSKLLAAGGATWDVKTGKLVSKLINIQSRYDDATFEIFSPDGKTVAVSGGKGPITLLDSQGKQLAAIKPSVDDVESLAYSPDSQNLAVVTKDGVEVYDLSAAPTLLKNYRIGLTYSVAFSPDKKSMLIGELDGPVYQFERTNPNNYQDFKGQKSKIKRVAYSSDGSRVVGIGDGYAIVWDTKSRQELARTSLTDTYNVTDMALSTDDKLLITAQSDGTVKVWQLPPAGTVPAATSTVSATTPVTATVAASPTPVPAVKASLTLKTATAPAPGHTASVGVTQLSPDGKILASVGHDTTIRLWDLPGKKLISILKGNFNDQQTLRFSRDGKTLAVYSINFGANGGLAQTWDVATGQQIKSVQLPDEFRYKVSFSSDLHLLAGATRDSVVVSDISKNQKVAEFAFPYGVADMVFSPDGNTLYAAGYSSETRQYIGIFNMQTGETINITDLIAGSILNVALSPDQKILAATTKAGPVVMVDGLTGKQLGSYTQPDKYVASALDFDTGNQLKVAYPDKSGNYQVYSVAVGSGKALGKVEFKGSDQIYPAGLTLNAANSVLAFGDAKGNLTAANYTDGSILAAFPGVEGAYPIASAFNPHNRTWLVLNRNGVVQVWDAALSKVGATLGQPYPLFEAAEYLALSPDGKLLATGGQNSKAVTLWNLDTNQKIATLPGSGVASALRFSSDSRQLLGVINYITLYSWEASDNFATVRKQASLVDAASYYSAKINPDGTMLAYLTKSNTLGILDLKANKASIVQGKFYSFNFLPNSQSLAVGTDSSAVKILDLDGKTLATLDKSYLPLTTAAFSPDGKIAASRNGGAVVLWDTATWGKIFDTGPVQTISLTMTFDADSKGLLSGNADGSTTLWEVK